MKLRLDLLNHLTAEDIRKAAEDSVHRSCPGAMGVCGHLRI